jgi:hypothetical protein
MSPVFDQAALVELAERTAYEIYLLEEVYTLIEDKLFRRWPISVIYAVNNPIPVSWPGAGLSAIWEDWRSGFRNAGAPLIFVSTFKLLDMLMEWVLQKNGFNKWPFSEKVKKLASSPSPIFPPLIESRPWVKERLISLYSTLYPLRGTIIHHRQFTVTSGALQVSSSKKGSTGTPTDISADHLRILASTIISVLRHVDGTWRFDELRERTLRYNLDELAALHGCAVFGQKYPYYISVRVYSTDPDPRHVNLTAIRSDLSTKYKERDCLFDLLVVIVKDIKAVAAYFFPYSILSGLSQTLDAEQYRTAIPDDIKPEHALSSSGFVT